MIIDSLENSKKYSYLGKKFQKAFTFLYNTNFANIENGKHIIEGENIYALVSEYISKNHNEITWEAHRKYVDLQYVAKGVESIGYSHISNMISIKTYDELLDYELFTGKGTLIPIKENFFMILFPEDCHVPQLMYEEQTSIKKVVIKIKL